MKPLLETVLGLVAAVLVLVFAVGSCYLVCEKKTIRQEYHKKEPKQYELPFDD